MRPTFPGRSPTTVSSCAAASRREDMTQILPAARAGGPEPPAVEDGQRTTVQIRLPDDTGIGTDADHLDRHGADQMS
jgi:hypothetical protein